MKNSKVIMAIIAGIIIAGGVIGWLMFGGEKPVTIKGGNGVSAQINASLKNSVLQREQDGRKLWEFTVEEVVNDKQKNTAYLKGIKGKVYRSDGSAIDISADKGTAGINSNDFSLEGKVKAVLSTGGELTTDKITWNQKTEKIVATGNFHLKKGEWEASGDRAETTSAFENFKLKGKAKVVKGGK